MPPTPNSKNFDFLAVHDRLLARIPSLAEVYAHDDPVTSLMKLRQFGELLAQRILANQKLEVARGEKQGDLLDRLRLIPGFEIPSQQLVAFQTLRGVGNKAVHQVHGDRTLAFKGLELARDLAVWFHRTYEDPNFEPSPYARPKRPHDLAAALRMQLTELTHGKQVVERRLAETEAKLRALADQNARTGKARDAAALQRDEMKVEREVIESLAMEIETALATEREKYASSLEALARRVASLGELDARALQLRADLAGRDLPTRVNHDRPAVWTEQHGHLANFIGRSAECQYVSMWLRRKVRNGYFLITAPPGHGKSAFVAALARRSNNGARYGSVTAGEYPHVDQDRSLTEDIGLGDIPVLLHMSKAGGDARSILKFLLWQASAYSEAQLDARAFEGSTETLRERLFATAADIAQQQGTVCIIIDALDELVRDIDQPAHELSFLPDTLPSGVRVILSTRPLAPLISHLRRRLADIEILPLEPLGEEDLAAFLWQRLDPPVFDWLRSKVGLRKILERTGGVPLLLRRLGEQAPSEYAASAGPRASKYHGDNDVAWIPGSLADVFDDAYREVRRPPGIRTTRGTRLREALVQIVALSNKPLSVSELVHALRGLRIGAESSRVQDALGQIGAFIPELSNGLHVVYHRGFAEYVAERIGADGRMRVHRALAGSVPIALRDVGARLATHVHHLLEWQAAALEAGDDVSASEAATSVAATLCAYDVLEMAIGSALLFDLIPLYERALEACAERLQPDLRARLSGWVAFVERQLPVLAARPQLLPQLAMQSEEPTLADPARQRLRVGNRPHLERVAGRFAAPDERIRRVLVGAGQVDSEGQLSVAIGANLAAMMTNQGGMVGVWRIDTGERIWVKNEFRSGWGPIAISPSGRYVAISESHERFPVNDDGEELTDEDPIAIVSHVQLMDARNGEVIWSRYDLCSGDVGGLAFSMDEIYLFVGAGNGANWRGRDTGLGTIQKLAIASGRTVACVDGLAPVRALACSTDGRLLVSAGANDAAPPEAKSDGDVLVWDTGGLELQLRVSGHSAAVHAVAILGEDRFVSGDEAGRLRICRLDGVPCGSFDTAAGIRRIECAHEARYVYVLSQAGWDGPSVVSAWNIMRLSEMALPDLGDDVEAIAVAADGRDLLVATARGVRLVADPLVNNLQRVPMSAETFGGRDDRARRHGAATRHHALCFSPDLRFVVVQNPAGGLVVKDALTDSVLYEEEAFPLPEGESTSRRTRERDGRQRIAVAPRGGALFVVNDIVRRFAYGATLIDRLSGIKRPFVFGNVDLSEIVFSNDGSLLMLTTSRVGSGGRELSEEQELELGYVQEIIEERRLREEASEVRVDVENRRVAKTADTGGEGTATNVTAHHGEPTSAAENEHGQARLIWNLVAAVAQHGEDTVVTLLEVASGEVRARINLGTHIFGLKARLSPDGRHLVAISYRALRLWVVPGDEPVLSVSAATTEQVQHQVVQNIVSLLGGADQALASRGEIDYQAEFLPKATCFSDDGKILYVYGTYRYWLGVTRRWDLESYEELPPLRMAFPNGMLPSMDGRFMLGPHGDGISVRRMDTGDEVAYWSMPEGVKAFAVRDEGRIVVADSVGNLDVLELRI